MRSVKKLCTFFQSSQTPLNSKASVLTLQDLPLEILIFILDFLPHSEAVLLRNECRLLRLAVSMSVKDWLRNACLEVRSKTENIKGRIIGILNDHRIVHSGLLKSLLAWWTLQTDLTLMNAMVWRYKEDLQVSCLLSRWLGGVLEEVDEEIKNLSQEEWRPKKKKTNHPSLVKFLNSFTEEIEMHINHSKRLVPFERRLIELLFSCPCGNIKMTVLNSKKGYTRTKVYCDIRDFIPNSKEKTVQLKFTEGNSRLEKEQTILRFFRDYVRKAKLDYFRTVIKQIEAYGRQMDEDSVTTDFKWLKLFIPDGDEDSIEHTQRKVNRGVEEVYEWYSTQNVSKYGLRCSFEFQSYENKPHPLNTEGCILQEKINQCEVPFALSTDKIVNNTFTLQVMSERNRTHFIKEDFVVFKPKKNTYILSGRKHYFT